MAKQPKTEQPVLDENYSKNALKSILKDTKDEHFAFHRVEPKIISTSSLILDSLVKVSSGQIVRLCAKGAELGKTSQAFVFANNYMETMPKSKTLFIKCEAHLSEQTKARSGMKFVEDAEDWDYGTVFIFPCGIFEVIAKTLETTLKAMHEAGEHLCIVWDSLDGVMLRQDHAKDMWSGGENVKVAGVPLLLKLLFKRFGLSIDYYSALMIVISQYSAEIKLDPYSKEPPRQNAGSGGSSLNHMSSYTFSYLPRYNGDIILEKPDDKPDYQKNKQLGIYATVEITKSGTDVSGTKVKIPIKKNVVGCAIWKEKECVDMMLAYELVNKKGAWITFTDTTRKEAAEAGVELAPQIQGINALYKYLEEDKAVFNWFYEKFKFIVSI